MKTSPSVQYQQDLIDPDFHPDPSQAAAIEILEQIYRALCQRVRRQQGWRSLLTRRKPIRGAYLWGNVGTGKSYLLQTFFHALPFKEKTRLHFHEFMHSIHIQLKTLQGEKNPLQIIAKRWAKRISVLCFDEFFVKDIGDAMLLGKLLHHFFAAGVCVVATANSKPEDLYQHGLQRERFLPAITLIQRHMQVIHVDNHIDYRLQYNKPAGVYFTPLNQHAAQQMMRSFRYYAGDAVACNDALRINGRLLQPLRHAPNVVWFDFKTLCETARSSDDYLQIAARFSVVMLSDVPVIAANRHDTILRFIHLIDVLYDRRIRFAMSAAAPIEQLYSGEKSAFAFKRTCSRLQQMQSERYLSAYLRSPDDVFQQRLALSL